jgi:6-pyruvoyltetrahydropterin/6-carboxytetrahydropterin synthase
LFRLKVLRLCNEPVEGYLDRGEKATMDGASRTEARRAVHVLHIDHKNDHNMRDTPRRVAKMFSSGATEERDMSNLPLALEHLPIAPGPGRAIYRSTKTYDHCEGLSCCFRQWRATHSHCRLVHGYALAFKFVFATHALDERNWCFDFGGLKPVRAWLHEQFDHTLIVAEDDPDLSTFRRLDRDGLAALRILPAVGCEAVAKYVFDHVADYVGRETGARVWLESVEVREHGGNSAIYQR